MTKQSTSRLPNHGAHDLLDPDGDGPGPIAFRTIVVTALNSGNFDGNHNLVAIGNQDGLVFGAAPSGDIARMLSAAQAVPGAHPGSGNTILVAASLATGGDTEIIIGSYNGNGNTVVIGVDNGIGLIEPSSSPALAFAAPRGGLANRLGIAANLPGHISYQSIRVNVENVGNNDGNANSVIIGNQNGIRFAAASNVGGAPVHGAVGDYSGDDNSVNIGNGNGATLRLNGNFALPAGALPATGITGGVVSVANLPALPYDDANTWFRLGIDPLGQGGFFGLDAPRLLKFESVRIDVRDSGNNDGNGNNVAIGNQNGISGYSAGGAPGSAPLTVGSYNGNSNLVEIGNGNGINLFFDGGLGAPDALAAAPSSGRQIVFQAIGISVANSGNNDGNANNVAIGNQNGIAGPGSYAAGLGGVIGSHDGNANTVVAGNGNGVNIHLGSNSGVIIGEFSGVASGYWLQDGVGDVWFGATEQEIGHDLISGLLPKLGFASLAAVTFESVHISALNVGHNDGNGNVVSIGNQNGITGTLAGGAAGSFAAGLGLSAGSFGGNGNLAQIGNGNGITLYV